MSIVEDTKKINDIQSILGDKAKILTPDDIKNFSPEENEYIMNKQKEIRENLKNSEKDKLTEFNSRLQNSDKPYIKNIIYESANPSPIIILLVVIIIVISLFLIYILFLKPSISGEWYDNKGNKWLINHNVLLNKASVEINNNFNFQCTIIDNYIKCSDLVGAWDYNNTIVFMDGIILSRVC
jgi:hypothetical protein